jgi:hypothetical protein
LRKCRIKPITAALLHMRLIPIPTVKKTIASIRATGDTIAKNAVAPDTKNAAFAAFFAAFVALSRS